MLGSGEFVDHIGGSRERTRRRFGSAGLTLALVLLLGTFTSVSASAEPAESKARPTISLALSNSIVVMGSKAIVTGRAKVSGRNLAKATVAVYTKPLSGGTWKKIATVKTRGNGKYSFSVTPSVGTSIRVTLVATSKSSSRKSIVRRLSVKPMISLVSPKGYSVALPARKKSFSGKVSPALAGKRVVLEGSAGTKWIPLNDVTVDASGNFLLSAVTNFVGKYKYRVVLPASPGLLSVTSSERTVEYVRNSAVLRDTESCYGAKTVGKEACVNSHLDGLLLPTTEPVQLQAESGRGFICWTQDRTALVTKCSSGSSEPDALRIALVGDSHAAGYVPALRDQLAPNNWHLDTYLGKACRWMELDPTDVCAARSLDTTKQIMNGDYDLVLYTGMRELWSSKPEDKAVAEAQAIADGYSGVWAPVIESGVPVFAVADWGFSRDFGCVTDASDAQASQCVEKKSSMYRGKDPILIAVGQTDGAQLIDMGDYFCTNDLCPMTRGNVLIYRDVHHITGMYGETLGPYFVKKIQRALDKSNKKD